MAAALLQKTYARHIFKNIAMQAAAARKTLSVQLLFYGVIFVTYAGLVLTFHSLFAIIIKHSTFRGIAQLVEQRSPKPRVEGSSPSAPAIYL